MSFDRRLLQAFSKRFVIWPIACRKVWGPFSFKDAASNSPCLLGGSVYVDIGMFVGCSLAASVSRARNCVQKNRIKKCPTVVDTLLEYDCHIIPTKQSDETCSSEL